MELSQLLKFITENREALFAIGALIAWFVENRRAARKSKNEDFYKKRTFSLEQESTYFKFQESLRGEQQKQLDRLNTHINDTDKKLAEITVQNEIIKDTISLMQRYLITHKYEQRADIEDLQELNDIATLATRSILAKIDLEEWDTLKELAQKSAITGDEMAVILLRIFAKNESLDNRYDLPTSDDILI